MCRSKNLLFHLLIFCLISRIHCEISENEIPLDESIAEEAADSGEMIEPVADHVVDQSDDVREEDESKVDRIERLVPDFENMGLEEAYKAAVNTYLDEHWDECIIGFNHFIER